MLTKIKAKIIDKNTQWNAIFCGNPNKSNKLIQENRQEIQRKSNIILCANLH